MYIPATYEMKDKAQMLQFIREHSFGILFSNVSGRPFATHLPMLLETPVDGPMRLVGHFARANPQWQELDGSEVLVVFPGPHAYISPSWYAEDQAVPTWNYTAVHVYGTGRIVEDEEVLKWLLREMVRFYEPHSPLLAHLDEPFYTGMMKAVVGFTVEITALEGKGKLSQNKSLGTRARVIRALQQSDDGMAREVGKWMQATLTRETRDRE